MAIIVVGGNGRGVGKTALVCGVIAALPELEWIAVKITADTHVGLPPVYEELASGKSAVGQVSDTARYLAAGASRAFLVTATDDDFDERLSALRKLLGAKPNVIFESNRVLRFLEPDLCLAIEPELSTPCKSSFSLVEREKHASVRRARKGSAEQFLPGPQPLFELAEFERISEPMRQWLRERVSLLAQGPEARRPAARRQRLA
jgi:hypothetical protein